MTDDQCHELVLFIHYLVTSKRMKIQTEVRTGIVTLNCHNLTKIFCREETRKQGEILYNWNCFHLVLPKSKVSFNEDNFLWFVFASDLVNFIEVQFTWKYVGTKWNFEQRKEILLPVDTSDPFKLKGKKECFLLGTKLFSSPKKFIFSQFWDKVTNLFDTTPSYQK